MILPDPDLVLGRLVSLADSLDFLVDHSFHDVYKAFIEFFDGEDPLTRDSLFLGASLVYSWMPTILTIHLNNAEEAVCALNKAKTADCLSVGDIEVIKSSVNNSVIGVSKLLHLINPESYPMIDRHVCSFLKLSGCAPPSPQMYLDYVEWSREAVTSPAFDDFMRNVSTRVHGSPSRLRLFELSMYCAGRQGFRVENRSSG